MFGILEVLVFSLASSQEELWKDVILTGSWGLGTAGSEDEVTPSPPEGCATGSHVSSLDTGKRRVIGGKATQQ